MISCAIPSKIIPVSLSHLALLYTNDPPNGEILPATCASMNAIVSSLINSLFALIIATAFRFCIGIRSKPSNSASLKKYVLIHLDCEPLGFGLIIVRLKSVPLIEQLAGSLIG